MTHSAGYSEDSLIEQPAIALFASLGWSTDSLLNETFSQGGGSHGRETRVGTITSSWDHFSNWKKVASEDEQPSPDANVWHPGEGVRETPGGAGQISLETTIRGTCTPERLLDIVESFTLFDTGKDALDKVLAKYHQYLTDPGQPHPVLSDRSDVIVMTDEAHRSQYDLFALNMRQALPNAAFIGFTGTPLMKEGEERTREVFGDYVSVYDFKQSIEDRATVPLYYENRIPELQLTNEHLNEDMQDLLEDAALDDEQEQKLEREFTREYHLVTRDDRTYQHIFESYPG